MHLTHTPLFSLSLLATPLVALSEPPISPAQSGRILFLMQQGEDRQALQLYQSTVQSSGAPDFELLHQISLSLLRQGFQQRDPECQLLALFGASISAHEEAYAILEESAQSPYLEIQLVALQALAHIQNDRADRALLRALGAPSLQVRFEALRHLCQKKQAQAASRAESLMYKTPAELWPVYPALFALIGDAHATKVLRKLIAHPSPAVRLAVILQTAKYGRDDLLPQIRQQALHLSFAEQEGCAYTLGYLQDSAALAVLERLTLSQYPQVSLAAHRALYQLGRRESLAAIETAASQGSLFAIAALGSLSAEVPALWELTQHADIHIRLNASLALLEQHQLAALTSVEEFLIRDKRDLAFIACFSPGKTFKAWKAVESGHRLFEAHPEWRQAHLELKETLLERVHRLDPQRFISIAHRLFLTYQYDLIPKTVALLEEAGSAEAIACLQEHQQQLGAPLVRHYCNLALYRLQEPGPYGDQLYQWVKQQSQTQLIRFQPIDTQNWERESYQLTPEETSRLLIESLEAFAAHQDPRGIETLIEVMANGHAKNKYALAGLLLRATQ